MQNQIPQMCKECIHREDDALFCKAFPAGIPVDILSGEFIHDKKHPDQPNRLLYEPESE